MPIDGSKILVIYSNKNDSPRYKADATGAFIPEAEAFAKLYGVPKENMLGVPCPGMKANKRREEVCVFLRNHYGQDIEFIGWFCHGYSTGIQMGFQIPHIPQLVNYLKMCCSKDVRMCFYACSTASTSKKTRNIRGPGTNNGFSDRCRDFMLKEGFRGGWVDGHLMPGHTTKLPYVFRFYTEPVFEEEWDVHGGVWLVDPKSIFWKKWKTAIQAKGSEFRFWYAMMTELEIYDALR